MKKITFLVYAFLACSVSAYASGNDVYVSETDKSCPVTSQPSSSLVLKCRTYMQTTNYTCGPAAVMTIMHYYGRLGSGELNRETEMRIASEMGATPGAEGGTTASQLSGWLSGRGFGVDSGQNIKMDDLIDNVKRGKLTILGYNQHWIVAKGFKKGATPEDDEVIFSDSCCNVRVIKRRDIDSMWQEAHMQRSLCRGNIGTYIVVTPGG